MSDSAVTPSGVLSSLSDDDLASFSTYAKSVTFAKGDDILAEGQYNASLFVVTEGLLHARLSVNGSETLLARLEPGTFFGEVSVFDPGKTSAHVVAVTKGSLLVIERHRFLEFVDRHPDAGSKLLLRLMQEIVRRIRSSDDRLGDAMLLNLICE